jgi:hypothetical protein
MTQRGNRRWSVGPNGNRDRRGARSNAARPDNSKDAAMNWYTLLELAGYIALTELAYLPLTWWLWRQRETQECDMTFRLTAHEDFAAHGAETQDGS